jgi:hypothetical protein
MPRALYSLSARKEALGRLAAGETLEESAPDGRDPDRIADSSTVRRWFWRRMGSLRFFFSPTILAWDWRAAARILTMERIPP